MVQPFLTNYSGISHFAWMQNVSTRQFLPLILIAMLAYQAVVPCCGCSSVNTRASANSRNATCSTFQFCCCQHNSNEDRSECESNRDQTPEVPQCPFCEDSVDFTISSRESGSLSELSSTWVAGSDHEVNQVAVQAATSRISKNFCVRTPVKGPLGVRLQV